MEENTMEKEKILEMSRQENKDKDLYELEIKNKASKIGINTLLIFCILLFVLNIIAGNGYKIELYAPVLILNAVYSSTKYKMSEENKKQNKIAMICWTISAVIAAMSSILAIF